MNYIKFLVLFFSTIVMMASSCHKNNDPDPNSFYFQCKVNGQQYIPNSCANCITCTIYKDTTFILGGNRGFETLGVGINDNSNVKISIYILNEKIGRRGDYKFSTTTNDRYFTDSSHTGQLQITTLDKTNQIIAGSFFFQGYNPVQNKTVTITEGKFRLKYTTN